MIKAGDVNLAMVKQVAEFLGPLSKKVVFLGGAATGLLITDEAAPKVRATKDVDVIAIINGRPELIDEVRKSDRRLKDFLAEEFQHFLKSEAFLEFLPGHLPPDSVSQAGIPKLIASIEKIASKVYVGDSSP